MADRLGIDRDVFRPAWSNSWRDRNEGKLGAAGALRALCAGLSIVADEPRIAFAASAWTEFLQRILVPRQGAAAAIRSLRAEGVKVGLVSDSPAEVPLVWQATELATLFDEAVFSCTEGCLKPDPRLYRAAAGRLGVEPEACLYVGNGDGDELAGALATGMRALLFTGPGEHPGREAATWQGPCISSIDDVLRSL